MYRNSLDKRVKQTTDRLFDAICELQQKKAFSDIGIKEVCELAIIGRATFYRNFDYVDDVFKLKLDEQFDELKSIAEPEFDKGPVNLTPFFEYWVRHSQVILALYQADRWDIFSTRFVSASNLKLLELSAMVGLTDTEIEYLQNTLKGMFSSILLTWIDRGRQETAAQLTAIFEIPFKVYVHQQLGALSENREE
ncbi:TetR-like C-terminal domain-containing protein [Reinekea sp. G2M2-21]|uniref:TetR-like C-terminal domain-containing protein n=1 Tax=Reinekea sp. G2M2-21 TaxID=2788942 RepID=UPI0018ABA5D6|nr:TetR-like C-terminal domain-containing protein [Reinekea sp. G2M2-21]